MTTQKGFTLIELMVVIAIVAVLAGTVVINLNRAGAGVEKDAQRIAALLEQHRAKSRSSGVKVTFIAAGDAYSFMRGARDKVEGKWQDTQTIALAGQIVLGPDPVIEPGKIVLVGGDGHKRAVLTDGVRPFYVETMP